MKQCMVIVMLLVAAGWFLPLQAQQKSITASDRTAVSITVYNQDLSLIREERTIDLQKGLSTVIIPDIPATIDGTSLHFSSLTNPTGVSVLEQNYQYDLVSQDKLLGKYIGKEVEFVRVNDETKKEYTDKGILLTSFNPGLIARINGKIEINPIGRLVLPSLPEGLILKPRLEWLVSSTEGGKQNTEISYLAGQISWNCNYVVLLNKDDNQLGLTGWVTLVNNSGTSFSDAALKLVAGDVNMVRQNFRTDGGIAKAMTLEQAPQFAQTDLFEYKLYTLQRHTDLNNNETKQIELVSGNEVAAKKVLIYDGIADQWRYWYNNYDYRTNGSFGQQSNQKVGVYITFKNDKASGLGIALPKGKVRVYKKDDDGKEQFIGENEIDHTPKDEEIKLYLGNAFDVVGERAQTDFKTISKRTVEETITIKVRNHKEESVEVQVYEHPWRWNQWEITHSSDDYVKIDQSTIKFPVKLAKDEEKVITYTIRYSW
ncbi:MAG: DUF4139 domain-containing protein [Bacteroidota bacterium]